MVCVFVGMRLPYLTTTFADALRLWILFPLLLSAAAFFALFYRTAGGRPSGYRQAISKIEPRNRLKATIWMIFGALVISGGMAWTSVAFVGLATKFFATEPYSHQYHVRGIDARSGAKWTKMFQLHLVDDDGREAGLVLTRARFEMEPVRRGDLVCLEGRRWGLGTIIERAPKCSPGVLPPAR